MDRDDGSTVWIVPDDGSGNGTATDCSHPGEDLQRLGSDGANWYFRCPGCGATIVSRIGG